MKLAIIPARGGSKRIPRKNVLPFAGKPMIGWTIEAAQQSGLFDRILVSTDDDEIADIARSMGADVPFMRPSELSDDHTGTIPVVAHAIKWQQLNGDAPEFVCCLYATAPFIDALDIKRGFDILKATACSYAFAVTSYPFPIQRAIRINEDGCVEMFDEKYFNVRSQDLEEAYHDAGQFYWGSAQAWISGEPIFSRAAAPVILPRFRVQDIDTAEDLMRAEWMFRALNSN